MDYLDKHTLAVALAATINQQMLPRQRLLTASMALANEIVDEYVHAPHPAPTLQDAARAACVLLTACQDAEDRRTANDMAAPEVRAFCTAIL